VSEPTETQPSKTQKRINRPQILILLGMLLINVCVYGGMLILSRGSESIEVPQALTASEPLELRVAYEQALALALQWQPDVQVVGATTSWQLAAGELLTLHRPAWSFSFYSPAAKEVQVLTVDQGGAQAVAFQSARTPPQQVAPDWGLNSDELLLTFLSYGGKAFIGAHPDANIHIQLKAGQADRPVWYITAVDPVARQSLIVGIDAQTRQVVLSETTGGGT
jgi:hypothetical protein